MLKKIRNRSPSKAESELMEFAKKLRYNNNGKIHIYEKKPSFSFKENQKTTINDLNKENFPKEKINLIKKKNSLKRIKTLSKILKEESLL